MTETKPIDEAALDGLKQRILDNPRFILEDRQLMSALLAADQRAGRKVVDLRGVLVERLEERLDRLEETHREVLAAAYENVAGTNQVHRACLAILDTGDFTSFLRILTHDVAMILGVEVVRLGLEAPGARPGTPLGPDGPAREAVVALPASGCEAYATLGRGLGARKVTLRQAVPAPVDVGGIDMFGAQTGNIRSEAVLRVDLGAGRSEGMLVFGAADALRFHPDQGVDLLSFFAGVFERSLRRWLE